MQYITINTLPQYAVATACESLVMSLFSIEKTLRR